MNVPKKWIIKRYWELGKKMGWNLPPVRIKFGKRVIVRGEACLAKTATYWEKEPNSKWKPVHVTITICEELRHSEKLIHREIVHEVCHVVIADHRHYGHGKIWKKYIRAVVNKNLYWF